MDVRTCPECRTKHNGLLCPKGCDVIGRGQRVPGTKLFRVLVQYKKSLRALESGKIIKTCDLLVRALTPAGAIKVVRDVQGRTVAAIYTVYEMNEPTGSGLVTQPAQSPTVFQTGAKLAYTAGAKKE